jgi:hypothetical protein
MAGRLQSSTISAPGFLGVNTQESSVDLASGYALEAYNCVIDKFGRIGARRGWQKVNSSTNSDLLANDIEFIYNIPETDVTLCAGNNLILSRASGASTLVTEVNTTVADKPGTGTTAYSITGNDWMGASIVFGEGPDISPHAYLAQAGHLPLVYHKLGASHAHTGAYGFNLLSDAGSVPTTYASASDFKPNVVIGAYGRTWWADIVNDKQTLYFSALLDGTNLESGDSGYLSLIDVFPNGDEIVGLAAHNGFLIIFGRRNIAVYANPIDVTRLELVDLVANVGCIARDSIVNTGTDVMFLSDTGVRSIARVIQEKSAPINDISFNVRDDLVEFVESETNKEKIKAAYYPKDAFYILTLPTSKYVFCFDLRGRLQNGAARVTIWDSIEPTALHVTYTGDLLIGKEGYLGKYLGFLDDADTYRLRYYTNYFDLGSPTTIKFLKKGNFVVVGGVGQAVALKYGFDYINSYRSITKRLRSGSGLVSEFNVNKYGVSGSSVVGSQSFSNSTPTTNTLTAPDGTHYQVAFKSVLDEANGYDLPINVRLEGDGFYHIPKTTNVIGTIEETNATIYLVSANGLSEYSSGLVLEEIKSNLGGSGSILQLGFEADINSAPLSIQKIDIYVKAGKTV